MRNVLGHNYPPNTPDLARATRDLLVSLREAMNHDLVPPFLTLSLSPSFPLLVTLTPSLSLPLSALSSFVFLCVLSIN